MIVSKQTPFTPVSGLYTVLLAAFLLVPLLLRPAADISAQSSPPDETIELKAVEGLQYDKVRFIVQPGATIKVVLENTDEMMHNMLITKPGTREQVVAEAEAMGEQGLDNDFIPRSSDVLAAIPLLNLGESASVTFQVPDEEGAYPYVCTFPAHGQVMYGVMHVTNQPELLPPVEEDLNVPEARRRELWMPDNSFHPYPMEMPQVTRLFMPDASPAAIAVGMEKNQSYCWDAGVCHLRYAWEGGYIDPSKQWDGTSRELAGIEGEKYYTNDIGFPFRIGRNDSIPKPEFNGYQLVDDYPQFRYRTGNITIYELIKPAEEGTGLKITYNLEGADGPIWYARSSASGIVTKASAGVWQEDLLRLSPEQAQEFTITIIPE